MNRSMDDCAAWPRLCGSLRAAFTAHGQPKGRLVLAQAPGVVDVMGGICEDAGSLVLTATLGLSVKACLWESGGSEVRVRMHNEGNGDDAKEFALPVSAFGVGDGFCINDRCRSAQAEWAAPACLVLHRALAESAIPRPAAGLMILLQSDFPADTDLGRPCSTATAVLDGLCKLHGQKLERLRMAMLSSEAVMPLTGLRRTRVAMTAICGAGDGSLLRMQFRPQPLCDTLALPPGVILTVARTRLSRPTTHERLLETRLCAEMGERMIHDLRRRDGQGASPGMASLATITPVDYVEHYRHVFPQKITAKAFAATFGTVRGLDGDVNTKTVYKVRSRAEHHIYENQRVCEFVADISRARRQESDEALIHAGELMYASHWSHSQRCGIGGAETDHIKDAIRARGRDYGLYGAKVTGGGAGGEVVVLMRNDEKGRTALAEAMKEAGAASKRSIEIYGGSLCGAEWFKPPELSELLASPA